MVYFQGLLSRGFSSFLLLKHAIRLGVLRLWRAGQEQVPLLERGSALHFKHLLWCRPSQGMWVSLHLLPALPWHKGGLGDH